MRSSALLLVGLMACADKAPLDTAEDTDSEAPPGDTTVCGAWTGFVDAGQTWTYDWVSGDKVGTAIMTLDDLDGTGGTAQTTTSYSYASADYTYSLTMVSNYVCDAGGLSVGTLSTAWETVNGEYTSSSWRLSTYDPPWLSLQRGAAEGSTWAGTTSVETQGNDVETATAEAGWAQTSALEAVTVPVGAYDALRVDVGADLGVTSWYAEGVGLVKTGDLQLVSMTP